MDAILALLKKNAKAIGSYLGGLVGSLLLNAQLPSPLPWWMWLILPVAGAVVAWASPKNAD